MKNWPAKGWHLFCAGKRCELDIDECGSNPCQHGGTCIDQLNGYRCSCSLGFMGPNCEINIDDCASNPCKHGGSCIDSVNSYKCVCELPYTGVNCDEKLDPCLPNRLVLDTRCVYFSFSNAEALDEFRVFTIKYCSGNVSFETLLTLLCDGSLCKGCFCLRWL